jgi:putative membrane protein
MLNQVIKSRGGEMRRSWSARLTWAGILSVALGLGIASAQTSEHDFVSQAAMSNMAAIQLGHLATKKAQNADVKKFAQTTIDENLKAQEQLADAGYGAGIRWPKKLDERHRQIQQRLSKLSNEQFDREYMKAMVERDRDIEKMLAARMGKGGGENTDGVQARSRGAEQSDEPTLAAKVNQWAAKTLPDVRAHLKEAEQVYGQLDKGE